MCFVLLTRWFFVFIAIIGGLGYGGYAYRQVAAGALGLELREIIVFGRNRTSNRSLFWALQMAKGNHMWVQSLTTMHARLESLPWVKSACVQRRLPWTLVVHLVEKTPMAIWQNAGKKCVIDQDGKPIVGALPKKFGHLIVVTGKEAPDHVRSLLDQLPKISRLPAIKAACFLRSQRWDLYLENGMRIQLPEHNRGKALSKMLRFWSILQHASLIDLRFSDALIFKPKPPLPRP
jgi:cell division protein FtsQ